jgi:hypothetical protein
MHIGTDFCGLVQYFDLIQHFYTAFCPADGFLTVKGTQLLDNFLLVFDLLLLFHVCMVFCCAEHFLLSGIGRIVAGKNGGFRIIELNHLICDPVQKITVMGHDDHCSFIVEQIRFQPGDGGHVQMVRRLIQNDQVRFQQQKLTQCHTGFLAAGKSGDRTLEVRLLESQSL